MDRNKLRLIFNNLGEQGLLAKIPVDVKKSLTIGKPKIHDDSTTIGTDSKPLINFFVNQFNEIRKLGEAL